MSEKADISNPEDVERLIRKFYDKVLADDRIAYIFTDVAQIDLEEHFPKLFAFWEAQLLGTSTYQGNPMQVHLDLNRKTPLEEEHFERWLDLFNLTVDELFEGPKAHLAKERALSIATVMRIKLASA